MTCRSTGSFLTGTSPLCGGRCSVAGGCGLPSWCCVASGCGIITPGYSTIVFLYNKIQLVMLALIHAAINRVGHASSDQIHADIDGVVGASSDRIHADIEKVCSNDFRQLIYYSSGEIVSHLPFSSAELVVEFRLLADYLHPR